MAAPIAPFVADQWHGRVVLGTPDAELIAPCSASSHCWAASPEADHDRKGESNAARPAIIVPEGVAALRMAPGDGIPIGSDSEPAPRRFSNHKKLARRLGPLHSIVYEAAPSRS